MSPILLKTSETLIIREATAADAARLIAYVKTVGDETDFLTFSGSEFDLSVEAEAAFVEAHRTATNQLFLIGELDGTIVSVLNLSASDRSRLAHYGEMGLSVLKCHWGKGIGRAMMHYMIDWAKGTGVIRKINLKVLTGNETAIQLYKKLGFVVEGTLRRDFYLNGVFQDTYCMGLLID
jgi:RimJ/RimL family protein N-acetyltransferase